MFYLNLLCQHFKTKEHEQIFNQTNNPLLLGRDIHCGLFWNKWRKHRWASPKIRNKWKQMPQTRKAMDTSWTMFLTQILQLHTTTTQKAHALIIDICWSLPRLQSTNTISHTIKCSNHEDLYKNNMDKSHALHLYVYTTLMFGWRQPSCCRPF